MASYLIVVSGPFADEAVLDWVGFRVAEGADAFHVVVVDRPGAEERLAALGRRIGRSGAAVSGAVSGRAAERVLRTELRAGHFVGVILAAEHRPFARLAGKVRRLQARHQVGVVWVGPRPVTHAGPAGSAPLPSGRVTPAGPSTDRRRRNQAAA